MSEKHDGPTLSERQMIILVGCLNRVEFMNSAAKQAMFHVQGARGALPPSGAEYLAALALSLRSAANEISVIVNEISGEELDANDVISSIEEMLDGKEPK